VIWGDYMVPKNIASITVHFEIINQVQGLLAHKPAAPGTLNVSPSLVHEEQVPVAALESFALQEYLSGQMAYMTLTVSGLAHFAAHDLSGGIDRLSRALGMPEAREMIGAEALYFYRGTARGILGHYKDADEDLSRAIQLAPKLGPAFCNRGLARSHYDTGLAILDYNQAIALDPRDSAALVNLGLILRHKGDLDGAIAEYDKAIACDQMNFIALMCRGLARHLNGQPDAAIKDFTAATRLVPRSAEAFDNRGTAFTAKNDFDHAIADHTRALFVIRSYERQFSISVLHGAEKGTCGTLFDTIIRQSHSTQHGQWRFWTAEMSILGWGAGIKQFPTAAGRLRSTRRGHGHF
jgi:tetratricopeptide (TPR) repeat protein